MQAHAVQADDVLTIDGINVMVRDVEPLPAMDRDKHRVSHVRLLCAAGRSDEGFYLTYPRFAELDIYRSEGNVEVVG